jgi:hypothetical protein
MFKMFFSFNKFEIHSLRMIKIKLFINLKFNKLCFIKEKLDFVFVFILFI